MSRISATRLRHWAVSDAAATAGEEPRHRRYLNSRVVKLQPGRVVKAPASGTDNPQAGNFASRRPARKASGREAVLIVSDLNRKRVQEPVAARVLLVGDDLESIEKVQDQLAEAASMRLTIERSAPDRRDRRPPGQQRAGRPPPRHRSARVPGNRSSRGSSRRASCRADRGDEFGR